MLPSNNIGRDEVDEEKVVVKGDEEEEEKEKEEEDDEEDEGVFTEDVRISTRII